MRSRSAALLVSVISLAGCGDDQEIDQSGLERARQEAERQENRQDRAEARLEAAQGRTSGDEASVASADPGGIAEDFEPYTALTAGWSAEVPVGAGWSDGVESEITPGRLFRTEFTGPERTILIIDSSPFDPPTFSGAPIDSRGSADHPVFGTVEKIIFQGNSDIGLCENVLCIDYLIPYEEGGYAVLAGGPGRFSEIEALAERVMVSLRYYDV